MFHSRFFPQHRLDLSHQLGDALGVGRGLVKLLLGLCDLGVDVDAALDVQEDGDRGGDGVGDGAGGAGLVGADDLDVVDALAREGLDGAELLRARLVRLVVVGVDLDLGLLLEGVLGHEGAGAPDAAEDGLVGGFRLGVIECGVELRVLGDHNGLGRVLGPPGHALPHLLGDERHVGVDHDQCALESSVQSLQGRVALLFRAVANDGLGVLDVDVAELGVPVAVDANGGPGELAVGETLVDLLGSGVHLVQDPTLGKGLARHGAILDGLEVGGKASQYVLGRLELSLHVSIMKMDAHRGGTYNLVAELAVAMDNLDIQVDITAAGGGVDHSETQSVGTALRNSIREGSLLVLGSLDNLTRVQIALAELLVELI